MALQKYIRQLRPIQENYVDHVEQVQSLLTESTKFSTSMENVIGSCYASTTKTELKKFLKDYSKDFSATKSIHKNNTDKLLEFGVKVRNIVGAGKFQTQKSGSITNEWKQWGGRNNTSKTDITLGEYKCSVKNMDGAQLMSGKKGESNATANAAALESGLKKEQLTKLTDAIDKLQMVTTEGWFASGEHLKTLAKSKGDKSLLKLLQDKQKEYEEELKKWQQDKLAKKKDKPKDLTKDEKRVLANSDNAEKFPTLLKGVNKEFVENMEGEFKKNQDELKSILGDLFKNNDDYKLAFVHEAATGSYKFGKQAQQTASHVLSWRKKPSIENFDIKLTSISKRTDTTIKTYANQIDLIVNWKSASKANHQGYNMWQNIRLGIKKVTDQRETQNESFCNELEQYQMQLNEGVLNEFAYFEKIKELVSNFSQKIKELWDRFTKFFKEQIDKILEISKQGLTALSNALGFEVEVNDTLLNNNKLRL